MDNELKVIITADDQASSTIKNVGNVIDDQASKVSKLSISMKDLGASMVQAGVAIGAAVAPLVLFGKSSVEMAGQFEQAEKAFQTLTGSIENGTALFNELKSFAKTTPFNLTNLQQYTKQLLAMGSSHKNVINELGMLGDMAASVGMDKMPQLVLAFGQVRAKTVLAGDDLKQFTETGIGLIPELSRITGISEKEIASNTKELGISFETVKKAITNLTSVGGPYFGMMSSQSQTLNGNISNLQDSLDQMKASIGGALLPAVKSLVTAITPMLEQFGNWAKENPKLIQLIAILTLSLAGLAGILTIVGGVILLLSSPLTVMIAGIGLLVIAIMGIVTAFMLWNQEIMNFVNGAIANISAFATNFWTLITTTFTNIGIAISAFFTGLVVSIQTWLLSIYNSHKTTFDLIWAIMVALWNFLVLAWNVISTTILYIVQLLWTGVQIMFWLLHDAIVAVMNAIGGFLTTIWNWIYSNVIMPIMTKISAGVKAGFELVKKYIITPSQEAFKWFEDRFQQFHDKVLEIKNSIVNLFTKMAEGVTNALRSIKFPHLNIGEGVVNVAGHEIKYPKLNVDWYEQGGWVGNTGLAMVHKGEFVLSREMLEGRKAVPSEVFNNNNSQSVNVYATINNEMDMNKLAYLLAYELRNK